ARRVVVGDDVMEHPSDGSAEGLKTRVGSIRSSSFHHPSSIHDHPTHDGRVQHLRLRFTVQP
ncbi:MAG: hypothetical protein M3461_14200, partial [Pseudomonadota bacterium]|nr:hypothetical protein [Pseudomonadota bacterium]